MFVEIRSSLAEMGVAFDVYFNERDLHTGGAMEAALDRLTAPGPRLQQDGATWLRTTDFGDDKDRPLIKSDGDWTYFAADCAYYLNKRERGFDRVVIMLGRRPPRLHRPLPRAGQRLRRRPRPQPRDPHRPAGQPGP